MVRGHSTGSTRGAHGRHGGRQGRVGTQAPGQATRPDPPLTPPTGGGPVCTQAWCWHTGDLVSDPTSFLSSRPATGGKQAGVGVGQDLPKCRENLSGREAPGGEGDW